MAISQRDVPDLARIGALETLPRLVASVASQTARLVNVSALAAPFEVSRPTIRDYLTLLQHVFMVTALPAWHRNRLQRLVKAPKLHMGDTGVAAAVLGLGADDLVTDRHAYGQLLETFVVQELVRQAAGDAFVAGVVLYDGEVSAPFGERLYALPVRDRWEPV